MTESMVVEQVFLIHLIVGMTISMCTGILVGAYIESRRRSR